MDIGYKFSGIKAPDGPIHDWFYNEIILKEPWKIKRQGQVVWITEMSPASIATWANLWANKDHIAGHRGLLLFIELPWANKSTPVPAYLPNRTYLDEQEPPVEQVHTMETWIENIDAIAQDKFMVHVTAFRDLTGPEIVSLEGDISGIPGASILVHPEYATNMEPGGEYREVIPEP